MENKFKCTDAVFDGSIEIDIKKKIAIRREKSGKYSRIAIKIFLFILGVALSVIISLFYWMLGVLFLLFVIIVTFEKRFLSGVWVGKCPHCESEINQHASHDSNNFGFNCPVCFKRCILRENKFIALE